MDDRDNAVNELKRIQDSNKNDIESPKENFTNSRVIGEIHHDALGHPFASLITAFDEQGNGWSKGTKIYAHPEQAQIEEPDAIIILGELQQLASEVCDHTPESFRNNVISLATRAHALKRISVDAVNTSEQNDPTAAHMALVDEFGDRCSHGECWTDSRTSFDEYVEEGRNAVEKSARTLIHSQNVEQACDQVLSDEEIDRIQDEYMRSGVCSARNFARRIELATLRQFQGVKND